MASWRADPTAQAQEDLDELTATCLELAQQQLDRRGEFYPFAAVVTTPGEMAMIQPGGSGNDDHPDAAAVLEGCWETLWHRRREFRAAAVVSDIGGPDGDAVSVALEHLEGQAIGVILPYQAHDGSIGYGNVGAAAGQPRVWA